ncbi:hypothetical protein Ancab_000302 [Ancistrocladus abbreviatus]
MRLEGSWEASRFVHLALAVEGQEATAYPLLAAMPSNATYQTGLLGFALSLPRPVIALDAISDSIFICFSFFLFKIQFNFEGSALKSSEKCECEEYLFFVFLFLLNGLSGKIIKYYYYSGIAISRKVFAIMLGGMSDRCLALGHGVLEVKSSFFF